MEDWIKKEKVYDRKCRVSIARHAGGNRNKIDIYRQTNRQMGWRDSQLGWAN
jgi:hypothetical protein